MTASSELDALRAEVHAISRKMDLIHAFLMGELGGDGRPGNVHRVLENVAKEVADLDRTMRGDAGLAGILTRRDRLERADEARTWQVRMLAGAVVSVAVKVLIDVLLKMA